MQVIFIDYSPSGRVSKPLSRFFFGFFFLASFVVCLALAPLAVLAQANPFGGPTKPAAANNTAANPQPAPALNLSLDPNLIIRRYGELRPGTPTELAQAILICTQISRTDVARIFIQDFEKLNVSAAQASAVQKQLGSAFLFELSLNPKIQPEGSRFTAIVNKGALTYMRDDARVKSLIASLASTDKLTRVRARDTFKTLDMGAAALLGAALGDPQYSENYREIQQAIIGMGKVAVEPIIGYLDVSDEQHRARVIDVLGHLGTTRVANQLVSYAVLETPDSILGAAARRALIQLVKTLPTKRDAMAYLQLQLDRALSGDLMLPVDEFNRITLWTYDEEQALVAPTTHDARVVALVLATRISKSLYSLDLSSAQYKRQFLRSVLASSKVLNGISQPLADGTLQLVSQESPAYVLSLLEHCLTEENYPAAVGAAEVLGAIGSEVLVYSPSGKPAPLVRLLNHPNRRVRFAVASAIFNINPQRAFPGCTFLSEAAGHYIKTAGTRSVLTGDVKPERSQTWSGLLTQIGFSGDRAKSGRDLVRMAQQSADYEFIMIGESIAAPHINDVVYMLRHDPRTAGIPIGIVVHDLSIGRANPIAAVDPLTFVLTEPVSVEGLLHQTRPLLLTAKYQKITTPERLAQAKVCLTWIEKVLANQQQFEFFHVQRQQQAIINALFVPPLSKHAATALAHIGSDKAQLTLATFASQDTEILNNRVHAVTALQQNLQKYRVLLTRAEILKLYDLYNKSLASPQQNIDVLSDILDAIESPTKTAAAKP
jgi:HEAT repeat protein